MLTTTTAEPLSVTDSSGRQISLLNNEPRPNTAAAPGDHQHHQHPSALFEISRSPPPSLSAHALPVPMQQGSWASYPGSGEVGSNNSNGSSSKRKYHCAEPGCKKSFTTSGHLARHNRIHTGEKNFPCLFPGCQSRFSRQDNMMQHYRTHMSPKSRRSHKRLSNSNSANGNGNSGTVAAAPEETRPRPRLHAHHRIRSDPFGVEPPLTIDQHLSIYRRSLVSPAAATERFSPVRYNNDASAATSGRSRSSSASSAASRTTDLPPIHQMALSDHTSLPPTATAAASIIAQSHHEDNESATEGVTPTSTSKTGPAAAVAAAAAAAKTMFYQHRPLTFSADATAHAIATPSSTTLLGPPPSETQLPLMRTVAEHQNRNDQQEQKQPNDWSSPSSPSSSSSDSLLQLAHVVSTFG